MTTIRFTNKLSKGTAVELILDTLTPETPYSKAIIRDSRDNKPIVSYEHHPHDDSWHRCEPISIYPTPMSFPSLDDLFYRFLGELPDLFKE